MVYETMHQRQIRTKIHILLHKPAIVTEWRNHQER